MTLPETFDPYPLKMEPYFSPRPWGGVRLKSVLGKPVPDADEPIGEAWELSDHANGRSVIGNGPWASHTFGDLYRNFPEQLCGSASPPEAFPLLVKYIDAESDLSIQVHPDDAMAAAQGDRGKSECWYVMDCASDACVIYDLKDGVAPEDLRRGADSGEIESMIRRCPIQPRDFITVPPGTIHAILGGTMICEIQQSSDLTYRLWDWNRKPARELHIEDSIQATQFDSSELPEIISTQDLVGVHELVANEFFDVRLYALGSEEFVDLHLDNPNGLIVNVVEGSADWKAGEQRGQFALGDTWFLPARIDQLQLGDLKDLRLLISRSQELTA